MKWILALSFLFAGAAASADSFSRDNLRDRLNECERQCSRQCSRLVTRVERQLNQISYNCGYDRPTPPPSHRSRIEFYGSDSCSGSYMGAVSSARDCEAFGRNHSGSVWGIKVDGQCKNIADSSALNACMAFAGRSFDRSVVFHTSDSCNGGEIATVDYNTDCREMARYINKSVWGISVNGRCTNITDTNFQRACELYKNEAL